MNSIYKLIIELVGKDSGASRELKQTKQEVDGLTGAAGKLSGALQAMGLVGMAYMGKQAVEAVWALGKLGAEAMQQADAFEELARQAGGSADAILAAMKRASGGTVAETDLILAANRGILLGLGAQEEQWEQLTEVARFRARAMGISVTQAVNDIATAIGRESKMIADNLGIIWDMDAIMTDYAATLGKTAAELTQTERKHALMNETIRIGQEQIEEAGGIARTTADDMAELEAAISDLKTELAVGLAPAIADAASGITKFITQTALGFQLLGAAMDGTISIGDYFTAGLEAQRIAAGQTVVYTTDAHEEWRLALHKLPGDLAQADTALDGHALAVLRVAGAYMALSDETKAWKAELTTADIAGMDPYETSAGQLAALEAIDQQREDNAEREEERAEEYKRQWENAIAEQERAYENLRSTVESALQPTVVTDYDMALTEQGNYVDKWDENARRLDAIAQGGFAELQAHPDWAEILKIPPEVLAGTEAGLKGWASQTSADVRNLFRPDLLDIGAAADAVEAYMQQQAAKEVSIDLVIGELVSRGGMTQAEAEEQVKQAYGLETEAVDIPINLISAMGEEGAGWGAAAEEILKGITGGITNADTSLSAEFAEYLKTDVSTQATLLQDSGYQLWVATEVGILQAMEEGNYVLKWVEILLPWILQALSQQGQWSGGGEP